MSKKIEIIRKALNHCGIPITDGIPEHILQELQANGYILRKTKAWKQQQRLNTAQQTRITDADVDAKNAQKRLT
jgi:hypothetical protein